MTHVYAVAKWKDGSDPDFIVIGRWPVFNLADIAITGGIALSLWPGNH